MILPDIHTKQNRGKINYYPRFNCNMTDTVFILMLLVLNIVFRPVQ